MDAFIKDMGTLNRNADLKGKIYPCPFFRIPLDDMKK
jgi:hypothetical protein